MSDILIKDHEDDVILTCLENIFNVMASDKLLGVESVKPKDPKHKEILMGIFHSIIDTTFTEGFEFFRESTIQVELREELLKSFVTRSPKDLGKGSFLTFNEKSDVNIFLYARNDKSNDTLILKHNAELVVSQCIGSFVKVKTRNSKHSKVTEKWYHSYRFSKLNSKANKTNMKNNNINTMEVIPEHSFVETKRPVFTYSVFQHIIKTFDLEKWKIIRMSPDQETFIVSKAENDQIGQILPKDLFRPFINDIVYEKLGFESYKIGDFVRIDSGSMTKFMALNGWYTVGEKKSEDFNFWENILDNFIGEIVDFTKEKSLIINFCPTINVKKLGIEGFNFITDISYTIRVCKDNHRLYNTICAAGAKNSAKMLEPVEKIAMRNVILKYGSSRAEVETFRNFGHGHGYGNQYNDEYFKKKEEAERLKKEEEELEKAKEEQEDIAKGPYHLDHLLNKIVKVTNYTTGYENRYVLVIGVNNVNGRIHARVYDGKTPKLVFFRASSSILDHMEIISGLVSSDSDIDLVDSNLNLTVDEKEILKCLS